MMTYLESIWEALLFFPLVAFLLTFPYMIYSYRKYGSFLGLRVFIFYTFALYLLCAYFLVILPFPDISEVAKRGAYSYQLIPFTFIGDIIKESAKATSIFSNRAVVQVTFNIVMTIPFGMYLRYFFNCSFKKTLLLGFLLATFFELTQLSGLYFIYPYNYRLFDVDDLMLNTLGSLIGYVLVKPLMNILPSREKMNEASYEKGSKVGFIRRAGAYVIDYTLIASIISSLNLKLMDFRHLEVMIVLVVLEILFSRTLGMLIFNTKLVSTDGSKPEIKQILGRNLLFFGVFSFIPQGIMSITDRIYDAGLIEIKTRGMVAAILIMIGFIVLIKMVITYIKKEQPFYDYQANVMLVSNVKRKKETE